MAENTTLRDDLARERTVMANERTLLAYGRTALGLVGIAVIIFKFAEPEIALVAGVLSLAAALAVFFWGLRSYRQTAAKLKAGVPSRELALAPIESD